VFKSCSENFAHNFIKEEMYKIEILTHKAKDTELKQFDQQKHQYISKKLILILK